jgi:hypothetical protein
MDINLLQQILTGLQQNNADLTTLVNNQSQQFSQQIAAIQTTQLPIGTVQGASGKIARPEPFDGTPEKLDIFIRELYLNFEEDAAYFNADHMRKIRFALSYMKAKFAAQWASRITGELEAGTRTYKDWDTFRTQLLTAFRDPNKKEAAQRRLEQLKQGTKPAAEFFVEFEENKSLAGYNDEGYIALLKRNLSSQVLERIYALETIPTTYDQWKLYALRFDSHLREYQALKSGPMGPRVWQSRNPNMSRVTPQPSTPQQVSTQPPQPPMSGPQPMDVDTTRGRPARVLTCFNCNEKGHIARNCPKPRGIQKFRALVEGWTNEQKAEVLESLKKEGFSEGQE